ncbi:heavy metal-binding domain-containing protein [uncultured Tateyamaria sp.]|uniref:heavy metal-binding domain-containing protein n=1 Tax=uncultured Tateyamaria sp. TaxID=455651 RepID=UPI00262DB306|nr:heavy metal-binding domain-containing protein [uncultured Tateyamaria sp.]
MKTTLVACAAALVFVAACDVQDGQYVVPASGEKAPQAVAAPSTPDSIQVFEEAPNRAFSSLGEIEIDVNKLTAFHPNPTREQAIERLRQEAAKRGADAIINVTVGEVKISPISWGSRNATATAVKF